MTTIEVWADVVCPWCWIGEERLLRAVNEAGVREDVRIEMRAFRLDRDPAPPRVLTVDRLQEKYGWSREDTLARMGEVERLGAELGLELHPERAITAPTFDAHRLVRAAQPTGQDLDLMTALHAAHFRDARDVGDHDVLRALAAGAGIEAALVDEVLGSDRHADDVLADEQEMRAFGAGGVPFVVLDRRLAVSGAQPVDVFAEAVRQARAAA